MQKYIAVDVVDNGDKDFISMLLVVGTQAYALQSNELDDDYERHAKLIEQAEFLAESLGIPLEMTDAAQEVIHYSKIDSYERARALDNI